MILAKTLAPEILEAISIGQDISYLKNNTSMCEVATKFEKELNLMYKWKSTLTSSQPLDALRDFAKEFIIEGPNLDTQTLLYFKNKINNAPTLYKHSVLTEMRVAFYSASKIKTQLHTVKPFISGVSIDKDQNFIDRLADALKSCFSPCNYLENVSDSVGTYTNTAELESSNTTPLWDTTKFSIQMSQNLFNKVSTQIIGEIIALNALAETTFKQSLTPIFSADRIITENQAINSDQQFSGSNILQNDYNTPNSVQKIATTMLGDVKISTGDCFRIVDNLKRFNYQDPNMNLGNPKHFKFVINNEGYQDVVDLMGRALPETPFLGSYKDLMPSLPAYAYKFDDSFLNWNTGGNSINQLSDGNQFETFNNEQNAVNSELPPLNNIDSYGDKQDPLLTARTANGVSVFDTKLDNYSMAVSEDVVRHFQNNNIQKGDYVQITLDNGTKFVRRYDDQLPAAYDGEQIANQYKLYKGNIVGNVIHTTKVAPPESAPQTWENGIPNELQPQFNYSNLE